MISMKDILVNEETWKLFFHCTRSAFRSPSPKNGPTSTMARRKRGERTVERIKTQNERREGPGEFNLIKRSCECVEVRAPTRRKEIHFSVLIGHGSICLLIKIYRSLARNKRKAKAM